MVFGHADLGLVEAGVIEAFVAIIGSVVVSW
jgi:hypothetical protein